MNLQYDRISQACSALGLEGLIDIYAELAATAASKQSSFADFLESLLQSE
jgi:hypothetical protein